MPATRTLRLQREDLFLILTAFITSLALRIHHYLNMPVDRLAETYHRWIISTLTLQNGFVYTDFMHMPNMTVVYLPFYQYLNSLFLLLTSSSSILIPRSIGIAAGSLTAIAVYYLTFRVYGKRWLAFIGGMVIAFQPWHIEFSTMGVPLSLAGLLVVISIIMLIEGKKKAFFVVSILAMLTSYEAWVFIFIESFIFVKMMKWDKSSRIISALIPTLLSVTWSTWSYLQAGTPFQWAYSILYSQFPYGWEIHLINPSELLFYTNTLLVITFFLFFIALMFGLVRGGTGRMVIMGVILYVAYYSVLRYVGLEYGDPSRLIVALPLISAVVPSIFPNFKGRIPKKTLLTIALIIVLIAPYLSQIWIFPQKAYVVMPEHRSGVELNKAYGGGNVLIDFPTIIYYSGITPKNAITYDSLKWYLTTLNTDDLKNWIKQNNVRYLVWENTSYSLCASMFPELAEGESYRIGDILFAPIYEDSMKSYRESDYTKHWEHHPLYAIPDVIVYEIRVLE